MRAVRPRQFAALSALLLGLGVAASAIGSHALAGVLDPDGLRRFQIATQVLIWQSLGLLGLMHWAAGDRTRQRWWLGTAAALSGGTVLFCVSLYALALGAPRSVASVAPLGGLLMIGGWLVASVLLWRSRD